MVGRNLSLLSSQCLTVIGHFVTRTASNSDSKKSLQIMFFIINVSGLKMFSIYFALTDYYR